MCQFENYVGLTKVMHARQWTVLIKQNTEDALHKTYTFRDFCAGPSPVTNLKATRNSNNAQVVWSEASGADMYEAMVSAQPENTFHSSHNTSKNFEISSIAQLIVLFLAFFFFATCSALAYFLLHRRHFVRNNYAWGYSDVCRHSSSLQQRFSYTPTNHKIQLSVVNYCSFWCVLRLF